MEAIVNKFKAKFKKVKEDLNRWEELQSCLVSQFRNASYIIDRLQLLQNSKNYGDLNCISGITEAVLAKQMQSLENIFVSMRKTLEEFHGIVLFLAKSDRDGRQLVKGNSSRPTMKQLQQRVGIKPRLIDCLDGLSLLHDIYYSEYQLKLSLVSALSANALKFSSGDLSALQQLLVDQPNIQTEEALIHHKYKLENADNLYKFFEFNLSLTSYLLKKIDNPLRLGITRVPAEACD